MQLLLAPPGIFTDNQAQHWINSAMRGIQAFRIGAPQDAFWIDEKVCYIIAWQEGYNQARLIKQYREYIKTFNQFYKKAENEHLSSNNHDTIFGIKAYLCGTPKKGHRLLSSACWKVGWEWANEVQITQTKIKAFEDFVTKNIACLVETVPAEPEIANLKTSETILDSKITKTLLKAAWHAGFLAAIAGQDIVECPTKYLNLHGVEGPTQWALGYFKGIKELSSQVERDPTKGLHFPLGAIGLEPDSKEFWSIHQRWAWHIGMATGLSAVFFDWAPQVVAEEREMKGGPLERPFKIGYIRGELRCKEGRLYPMEEAWHYGVASGLGAITMEPPRLEEYQIDHQAWVNGLEYGKALLTKNMEQLGRYYMKSDKSKKVFKDTFSGDMSKLLAEENQIPMAIGRLSLDQHTAWHEGARIGLRGWVISIRGQGPLSRYREKGRRYGAAVRKTLEITRHSREPRRDWHAGVKAGIWSRRHKQRIMEAEGPWNLGYDFGVQLAREFHEAAKARGKEA